LNTFQRMRRLSMHTLKLLAAGIVGICVRWHRRVLRRPPRIWHGPRGLHLVRGCVAADRLAGYPSRSVAEATGGAYLLFEDQEFDMVWEALRVPREDWHWNSLADLLRHADVWVAFFDSLIFPLDRRRLNSACLRAIRLLGIRIVVVPHGMDVVYRQRKVTRFDWVAGLQRDYPDWDFAAHAEPAQWRTRLWCGSADLVINADSTTAPFVPRRDITFKWFPADTDRLRPAMGRGSGRLSIVHAPQHRWVKGTEFLLEATRLLASRGFDFELKLIEKVDRRLAIDLYAEADIVADQFCMGTYGMFALEGLALGKPVLAYLDHQTVGDPAFNLPIVNTTPENLVAVLAVLLRVQPLRVRLGHVARAAAERYQSPDALAEVWDAIYRHVWWREPLRLEQTRHFAKERRPRSFTEDPAHLEFWPVPVADLSEEIAATLGTIGWHTTVPISPHSSSTAGDRTGSA
jgi:hypothetical protein